MGVNRHVPVFQQLLDRPYMVKVTVSEHNRVRLRALAEKVFRPRFDLSRRERKRAVNQCPAACCRLHCVNVYEKDEKTFHTGKQKTRRKVHHFVRQVFGACSSVASS